MVVCSIRKVDFSGARFVIPSQTGKFILVLFILAQIRLCAQDSIQKKYDTFGNLSEVPWKNGKINGIIKNYGKDGRLVSENAYTDDALNGYSKKYYRNGRVARAKMYLNNKANGPDSTFNETGKLKTLDYFKSGIQYKALVFDTSGLIIREVNMENGISKAINKRYREGVLLEEDFSLDGIIKQCKIYNDSGKIMVLPDTTFFSTGRAVKILYTNGRKFKGYNWSDKYEFINDSNRYVTVILIQKNDEGVHQTLYHNNQKIKVLHQSFGKLDWCRTYVDGKEEKLIEFDESGRPEK